MEIFRIANKKYADDLSGKGAISELPENWFKHPAPEMLAEIGDAWAKSNSTIALKVPSVIVPTAHNYVLNCSHPQYRKVKVTEKQSFPLDPRLSKKE